MIPFSRLIKYGYEIPEQIGVLVMHADDGFVDLKSTSRVIQKSTNELVTSTVQHLEGLTYSYNCALGYIIIPVSSMGDLNIGKTTGDFTIEYFSYINSFSGSPWYISSGTGSTSGVKIFGDQLYLQSQTASTNVGVSTINNGTYVQRWIHIALVQSSSTVSWYMNGTRILTTTGRWGSSNTPLRIGGYEQVSNSYIDQIRISNRALYAGESFTVPLYPLN